MSDNERWIQGMTRLEQERLMEYLHSDRYKARAAELYAEIESIAQRTGISLSIPSDTPMIKFQEFIGHMNGSCNVFQSRLRNDFTAWWLEVYGEPDQGNRA